MSLSPEKRADDVATPNPAPTDEVVIAQWQEPALPHTGSLRRFAALTVTVGTAAAGLAVAYGYWKHELNAYLVAGFAIAATLALITEKRRPSRELPVSLTNYRIGLGNQSYPLAELAGFWTEAGAGATIVNVESKRNAFLPLSILFPSEKAEEARAIFIRVLPEVAPRANTLADQLNRIFKW